MKTMLTIIIILIININCISQSNPLDKLYQSVSIESIRENMYFLAGNKCEGRLVGSYGDSIATEFIENWMKKYKLIPGNENSYRQTIEFVNNSIETEEVLIDGKKVSKRDNFFYYPRSFAIKNGVEINDAPIVFINYGISSPNYDDFNNIDVKGKIVLNVGGAHQFIKDSLFLKDKYNLDYKDYNKKGALAAFYFSPFSERDKNIPVNNDANEFVYSLKVDSTSYYAIEKNPFPDILLSNKLARELLGENSFVIDSLTSNIHYLKNDPQAFDLNKKMSIHIKRKLTDNIFSDNVIGCIKGSDTNSGNIVVVAHRDHLGKIEDRTMYGADDNASGTVTMMECAKAISILTEKGIRPKRTIIFISLAAEEQGWCGAQYYTEHPTVKLDDIKYVINIDMLGRIDQKHAEVNNGKNNYIYPVYLDSMYDFKPIIDEVSKNTGLIADDYYIKNPTEDDMIYRSDHAMFWYKGIPFIWFFSGIHDDYHKTTDNAEKIEYSLLTDRTKFTLGVLWKIANN